MARHVRILRDLRPTDDAFDLGLSPYERVEPYVHGIYGLVKVRFGAPTVRRRSDDLTEHHWKSTSGGDVTISFYEDGATSSSWVMVSGDEPPSLEVTDALALMIQFASLDDLLADAAEAERHPGAFCRLALGLNDQRDERAVGLLARGLKSQDLEVRMDAAMSATILKWPALVDPLQAALLAEPTEEGRRGLQHALTECRSQRPAS